MSEIFELGRISSRGQVAIPVEIRKGMGLKDGSKVLFFLEEDTLLIKKVSAQIWDQITKPLRQLKKKIPPSEVTELIHKMR